MRKLPTLKDLSKIENFDYCKCESRKELAEKLRAHAKMGFRNACFELARDEAYEAVSELHKLGYKAFATLNPYKEYATLDLEW